MKDKHITVLDLMKLVPEHLRDLPIYIDEHMKANPITAELHISMDPKSSCVLLKDED